MIALVITRIARSQHSVSYASVKRVDRASRGAGGTSVEYVSADSTVCEDNMRGSVPTPTDRAFAVRGGPAKLRQGSRWSAFLAFALHCRCSSGANERRQCNAVAASGHESSFDRVLRFGGTRARRRSGAEPPCFVRYFFPSVQHAARRTSAARIPACLSRTETFSSSPPMTAA